MILNLNELCICVFLNSQFVELNLCNFRSCEDTNVLMKYWKIFVILLNLNVIPCLDHIAMLFNFSCSLMNVNCAIPLDPFVRSTK